MSVDANSTPVMSVDKASALMPQGTFKTMRFTTKSLLCVSAIAAMAFGTRMITSATDAERPRFRLDSGMDMPPDEPIHSTGWSRLGDLELAEWYAEYDNPKSQATFEMLVSEGTRELEDRGITIKECGECGHKRMNYNHDYMCILCRRAW